MAQGFTTQAVLPAILATVVPTRNGSNQLTRLVERDTAGNIIATTNFTYNGDGTVATSARIEGTVTTTRTFTYVAGFSTGFTSVRSVA